MKYHAFLIILILSSVSNLCACREHQPDKIRCHKKQPIEHLKSHISSIVQEIPDGMGTIEYDEIANEVILTFSIEEILPEEFAPGQGQKEFKEHWKSTLQQDDGSRSLIPDIIAISGLLTFNLLNSQGTVIATCSFSSPELKWIMEHPITIQDKFATDAKIFVESLNKACPVENEEGKIVSATIKDKTIILNIEVTDPSIIEVLTLARTDKDIYLQMQQFMREQMNHSSLGATPQDYKDCGWKVRNHYYVPGSGILIDFEVPLSEI